MTNPEAGPSRVGARLYFAIAASLCLAVGLRAQTAITSISVAWSTTSTSSVVDLGNGTSVTMENDSLSITQMQVANGTDANYIVYNVDGAASATTAFIRTVAGDNNTAGATTDPVAVSAWYMGTTSTTGGDPTTLLGQYNSAGTSSIVLGNNLLQGSDNLFNNVNDNNGTNDNASDVLRLDYEYGSTGLTASSTLSFAVFDRGTGDSFAVAVITGIDSNGNPTAYGGKLVVVNQNQWGTGAATNLLTTSNMGTGASTVLNDGSNEPTDYLLRYDSTTSMASSDVYYDSDVNNQNVSGLAFNMSQFDIATGTTIYGYSIMSGDVTDKIGGVTNINDLVNYNNTTYFPTNASDQGNGVDESGLDPVAVGGVVFYEAAAPEPSTYGGIFLGLCLAGVAANRLRQRVSARAA